MSGQDSARVAETRTAARAAGTAFVTYVVHRGRWTAVTASARRPALVDLADAADVDELVQRVRADLDALAMPFLPPPLKESVRRSLDAGLRRLDDLLLAPVGVEGQPLVVSCSAALVLLPWSLLPSRRGLPVVVTPSATAWLRAGDHVRRTQPRVVSVAGPGLHRAEDEARRVHALWAGRRAADRRGGDHRVPAARARRGRRGARRRARHPPAGQPVVLLAAGLRRTAVRLRARRR